MPHLPDNHLVYKVLVYVRYKLAVAELELHNLVFWLVLNVLQFLHDFIKHLVIFVPVSIGHGNQSLLTQDWLLVSLTAEFL